MKKIKAKNYILKLLIISVCCLFIASATASTRNLSNRGKKGLYIKSLKRMLRMPDEEIDIATAVLLASNNWNDDVNVRKNRAIINQMAFAVLEIADRDKTRVHRHIKLIKAINTYMYGQQGYTAVKDADDVYDLLLNDVIARKQGYCLSLSIVYLALGERVGLPLYGIVVPGHFFVKYDNGEKQFNIEATSNGSNAPDSHYIEKFKVPLNVGNNIYLQKLTNKQTMGCFFNNLGNCYITDGDYDNARHYLEMSVELAPKLAEGRSNLGNVYIQIGQYRKAITQLKEAIKINPDDAKAYINLGNAYLYSDNVMLAINQYLKATKIDAKNPDAYIGLATAYRKRKMYNSALTALDNGLKYQRGYKWWREFATTYKEMGELNLAIQYYERAAREKPNWSQIYFEMAMVYHQLGATDDEIQNYLYTLELEPDMSPAMQNLGNAYLKKESYDLAIETFSDAIVVDPKNSALYFGIAIAHSQQEDFDQAIIYYTKAIKLDKKDATAYYNLAICYYNTNQFSSALQCVKLAQSLGFDVSKDFIDELNRRI